MLKSANNSYSGEIKVSKKEAKKLSRLLNGEKTDFKYYWKRFIDWIKNIFQHKKNIQYYGIDFVRGENDRTVKMLISQNTDGSRAILEIERK